MRDRTNTVPICQEFAPVPERRERRLDHHGSGRIRYLLLGSAAGGDAD